MLKKLIRKLVKKYGMKKLLVMVGDWAVSRSPGEDDDMIWNDQVKPFIEDNF